MKLRTKVGIGVIAIVLAALLAVGFLSFDFTHRALETEISSSQSELARQTMDKIDRLLEQQYTDIKNIGEEEALEAALLAGARGDPVIVRRLKELLFLTGPWEVLFVVNQQGTIIASTNEDEIGVQVSSEPNNYKAYEAVSSHPSSVYYSDIVRSDDTGNESIVFGASIRSDVVAGRPFVGAVIGNFSWNVIPELLQNIKTDGDIELYTNDGTLIATNKESPASQVLLTANNDVAGLIKKTLSARRTVTTVESEHEGSVRALLSLAPSNGHLNYRGNNWVLAMKIPTALAFAPAVQQSIKIVMLLIPIFLITIAVSLLFLSRVIVAPVIALSRFTKAVSDGDFSNRVTVGSKDEIGDLAMSFNLMTATIQESISGIRAEKKKIELLVESIGDGVMATDENGRIIIWNKAAERITGWPSTEALGRYWREVLKLLREIDKTDNSDFIDEAIRTKTVRTMENHTVLLRKDGREISVEDSAAPIVDSTGGAKGAIIVFRDATIERALDRAKEEFVSVASHQLRTPLTAIMGYTGMLLDEDVGKLNEKQRDYLQEIERGNNRMIELVTALLNVSRIDLGIFSVEPEPVNVAELALSVLKELDGQITAKRLHIHRIFENDLPIMNVDPQLMRMVFQNLLSNAVKYTQAEGIISLEIKKQDQELLITVADNGHGIPHDAQSRIFTKLYRADNARVIDPDGTGLGLYIIKMIAEESGGKIRFESQEDHGTTFFVTLPLSGMKARSGSKKLQ